VKARWDRPNSRSKKEERRLNSGGSEGIEATRAQKAYLADLKLMYINNEGAK